MPTVPICVHPKSLKGKAICGGSDRYASSGSTVTSFLSQDILCDPWNKWPIAPLPNLDYVSKTTSENEGDGSVGGGRGGGSSREVPDKPINGTFGDPDGPHRLAGKLTYRQPAQNGVLTDQLCRAIYCIQLSIMSMQIAITIA